MINKPLSELANESDIRIGSIRYAFYLITAPFIYLKDSYPSYEGDVYDFDKNYFINKAVERRLSKEADLEQRVKKIGQNQN